MMTKATEMRTVMTIAQTGNPGGVCSLVGSDWLGLGSGWVPLVATNNKR